MIRLRNTNLLIVGAGPFGLAMSAYARHLGIDHLVVGVPLEFWNRHMPAGLVLRSGIDWHLDPLDKFTIQRYLETSGINARDVQPLSLATYRDYAHWFIEQYEIECIPHYVTSLNRNPATGTDFLAALTDGTVIQAGNVLLALGFKHFQNIPADLTARLSAGRYEHTCQFVDFAPLNSRRVLIIGGRQSAFEWAALTHEAGATEVHVVYRHDTPAFTESDWSWVNPLLEMMVDDPAWFRNLEEKEQQRLNQRFWAEGRLKLEPWLAQRLDHPSIKLWPRTEISACSVDSTGQIAVALNTGEAFVVDRIILATGYKVDISRWPLLADGNLLSHVRACDGFPALDPYFQTSVPGLYMTSMAATRDFGAFLAFTSSVRMSARVIGNAIKQRQK